MGGAAKLKHTVVVMGTLRSGLVASLLSAAWPPA